MSYFGLPLEVLLNVLDQLVGFPDGRQPIFDASNPITKTLRALTLTSRTIYPIASRYLYSHCLYLGDCVGYSCLRRTLGLDLGNHPQSLPYGQAGRNDRLWHDANIHRYITSVFISPMRLECSDSTPVVRLPQILDLCDTIGSRLKRLVLDIQPVHFPHNEDAHLRYYWGGQNVFLQMPNLEELVVSYDVMDYFPLPPPNLKRLTITTQDLHDAAMRFCFSVSTLKTLILLRPIELSAADIDSLFTAYKGLKLDVIFVAVNSNHRTPKDTRNWTDGDTVTIWEADVPTSFYGDDDDLALCDSWIWSHAVQGTLWTRKCRRMASWSEVQRRLAGPVHYIVDDT
ncbi:uncharacterized protein EKO05_0001974 [Ascochyta rabiei]|uniref:Uncharacterized protein n=1 Tax=Didymella rabiei TaxID=5454 RepID=A0A163FNN2_DIDRA|nr:uncharacterized protein EKO05_0001974 [Ascochyta rabiei]KZM24461.1 hypothetical protein ST47_g4380 [Ascochyta rabiei]UPX11368.1 hypothetical protein EKO05_0001974 [Ascochyta rabiei]